MAKNFYTLQEYIMKINGKEVVEFRVKAYKQHYNALFTFGKSEYGKITPYAEEFLTSKKEGEERKQKMEQFLLDTGREVWNYKKHGVFEDYTWEFNKKDRVNYGTLKKSK